jgi:hypothetical protein
MLRPFPIVCLQCLREAMLNFRIYGLFCIELHPEPPVFGAFFCIDVDPVQQNYDCSRPVCARVRSFNQHPVYTWSWLQQ